MRPLYTNHPEPRLPCPRNGPRVSADFIPASARAVACPLSTLVSDFLVSPDPSGYLRRIPLRPGEAAEPRKFWVPEPPDRSVPRFCCHRVGRSFEARPRKQEG